MTPKCSSSDDNGSTFQGYKGHLIKVPSEPLKHSDIPLVHNRTPYRSHCQSPNRASRALMRKLEKFSLKKWIGLEIRDQRKYWHHFSPSKPLIDWSILR